MKAGTKIVVAVAMSVLAVGLVFFFVPLVGAQAVPPNWQWYTTTTTVQGAQTQTMTLARNPPGIESSASLAFCFLGHGALLQNGTYYPYTASHLEIQGAFCPTPSGGT
jgi:hypothetical protein